MSSTPQADSFLNEGGDVDLVVRENHVQLVVSFEAARREGLQISSMLLRIAQVQE